MDIKIKKLGKMIVQSNVKEHYRLYKSGKQWVNCLIVVGALATGAVLVGGQGVAASTDTNLTETTSTDMVPTETTPTGTTSAETTSTDTTSTEGQPGENASDESKSQTGITANTGTLLQQLVTASQNLKNEQSSQTVPQAPQPSLSQTSESNSQVNNQSKTEKIDEAALKALEKWKAQAEEIAKESQVKGDFSTSGIGTHEKAKFDEYLGQGMTEVDAKNAAIADTVEWLKTFIDTFKYTSTGNLTLEKGEITHNGSWGVLGDLITPDYKNGDTVVSGGGANGVGENADTSGSKQEVIPSIITGHVNKEHVNLPQNEQGFKNDNKSIGLDASVFKNAYKNASDYFVRLAQGMGNFSVNNVPESKTTVNAEIMQTLAGNNDRNAGVAFYRGKDSTSKDVYIVNVSGSQLGSNGIDVQYDAMPNAIVIVNVINDNNKKELLFTRDSSVDENLRHHFLWNVGGYEKVTFASQPGRILVPDGEVNLINGAITEGYVQCPNAVDPDNNTPEHEGSHDKDDQRATADVTYIDGVTGQVLRKTFHEGQAGDTVQTGTDSIIRDYENAGYVVGQRDVEGSGVELTKGNTSYIVVLNHRVSTKTTTKTVHRTIHYIYEDGQTAATDVVQSVTYSRAEMYDAVTKGTAYGEWQRTGSVDFVASPYIDGYTPDKTEVGAFEMTPDTGSFQELVTYKKTTIPALPLVPGQGNEKPGNPDPKDPTDPEKPDDGEKNPPFIPTPKPQPQPEPDYPKLPDTFGDEGSEDDEDYPELPDTFGEEETDDEDYPELPDTFGEEETVEDETPVTPAQTAVADLVAQHEAQLPQTGNAANAKMTFAGMMLALANGLLLFGHGQRRHED